MKDQLPLFVNSWDKTPETPFYAYNEAHLDRLADGFLRATTGLAAPLKLHFAMKANGNPHVLGRLRKKNIGVDLVSGGELKQALKLGFAPENLVFSGVGKTDDELRAAVQADVAFVNLESEQELTRLSRVCAELKRGVTVAFRVNPDVDARTHPYISTGLSGHKFGVDMHAAPELYRRAAADPWLEVGGVSVHIGSQMKDLGALSEALTKTIDFARALRAQGIPLRVLDVGGGLGVNYEQPLEMPHFEKYGSLLKVHAQSWATLQGARSELYSECGRAIVAQAGFLVTRVIGVKQNGAKHFAIVDASMTELLRPSLYQAWHPIELWPPQTPRDLGQTSVYDVVGPVCESSDVLGRDRELPELREGDLLVIGCAGAYGYVMSSFYNARPLPAEWWCPATGAPVCSRAPVYPL